MLNLRHALSTAIGVVCISTHAAHGQVDFAPPLSQGPAGIQTGRAAFCEMDGANGPDLVFSLDDFSGFDYAVLLNDGAGYTVFDLIMTPGSAYGGAVACCDFDGDGLMDALGTEPTGATERLRYIRQIAVGNWDDVEVRVLPGDGDAIACCDLNGDGLPDILIADRAAGLVDVYLNDGSGTLASLTSTSYGMTDVVDVDCCDIDADGDQDMLAISKADGRVRVRLNNGTGVFGPITLYAVGTDPADIACCDLDGDGLPDLVVPSEADDSVAVLLNDGSGGFLPTPALPAITSPRRVACGDFDCDGAIDLAVSSEVPTAQTLKILLNNGSGTGWTIATSLAVPNDTRDVFAGDIDGVAGTDVLAFSGASQVTTFLNITTACLDCIEPPADAAAWYPGDLCLPDDLFGNHDGTQIGTGFCPLPKIGGGALGFASGPPAYVLIPPDCELDPGPDGFSVNAWVRTNERGLQPIALKGLAPGWAFDIFDGLVRLVACDTTTCWQTKGSTLIDDGAWHHVAFTITPGASTALRVWVDGLLEDMTLATVGDLTNANAIQLGAAPSGTPSFWLDGAIDELQLHRRALSAAEIHAIYLSGIAGQCKVVVCEATGDGEDPDAVELLAGTPDDFAGGPPEPAVPGAVLAAECAGSVDFDQVAPGTSVCHTFDGLTENMIGATLEISVLADLGSDGCDDTISLQATGGGPAFEWTRRLGEPDGCPGDEGLLQCAWDSSRRHTFCLDLAALPELGGSTSSVLDDMNLTDRLDVRVAGDSAVDYIRLRLAVCPCPGDASCDGEVDVTDLLDVLADWGPCPPPCPPCAADVTGDCTVDVSDLLLVLGAWGPC